MADSAPPARPPGVSRRGIGAVIGTVLLLVSAIWAVLGVVIAPVLPGGWWGVAALAALVTPLPLALLIRQRVAGRYPGRWARLFLLRPFWYAQLLLLLLPVPTLAGLLVGWAAGAPRLGGLIALGLVAAVFALASLAGYLGSRRLAVQRLEARWPDLPEGLDGLRIVQLSDLHVGPHTSRRFLARVRALTEAERPDLIVVTGDLIDDHAPDVDHYAAALGDLAAPLGVVAVAGNHDVYAGWPEVLARLRRLPLTVLVNEVVVLERQGARLALLGTGDPAGGRGGSATGGPAVDAALARLPRDAFPLALAHNPALWPPLAAAGVRLTLSGHTHWGQFAIPGLGWSLASPFLDLAMGGYTRGDALLYVHPGTNYWGIPFRLGTPPEVAVLTLRRGSIGLDRAGAAS